jgi:hypothetical protein
VRPADEACGDDESEQVARLLTSSNDRCRRARTPAVDPLQSFDIAISAPKSRRCFQT